jgi:hypothetical protein
MDNLSLAQWSLAPVSKDPAAKALMDHAARLEKHGHYLESDAKWAEYDRLTANTPGEKKT